MWRRLLSISLISVSAIALTACGDGNPFDDPSAGAGSGGSGNGSGGNGGNGAGDPPSGNPILDTGPVSGAGSNLPGSIARRERPDGEFAGRVSRISYDDDNDTFRVDGLAFDGGDMYSLGHEVQRLPDNGYWVYDAFVTVPGRGSNDVIPQTNPYRLIYGASQNNAGNNPTLPRTSFAIVRTGASIHYGFGGFLYARNGEVIWPEGVIPEAGSGQAQFTGDYAGIRVFEGREGMEFTTGNMAVAVDFDAFEEYAAVRGTLTDRVAYDVHGAVIPLDNDQYQGDLYLPDLHFVIQGNTPTLSPNGEIAGNVTSCAPHCLASDPAYERGTYYGVIAGDLGDDADGGEIVGIIVVESNDPRYPNVTAQETGGFIVYW